MAQYENSSAMQDPETGDIAVTQVKVVEADVDDFAKVVQEK